MGYCSDMGTELGISEFKMNANCDLMPDWMSPVPISLDIECDCVSDPDPVQVNQHVCDAADGGIQHDADMECDDEFEGATWLALGKPPILHRDIWLNADA